MGDARCPRYAWYTGERGVKRVIPYASAAYLTSLAIFAGLHVVMETPLDKPVFGDNAFIAGLGAFGIGMLAVSYLPKFKKQGWL